MFIIFFFIIINLFRWTDNLAEKCLSYQRESKVKIDESPQEWLLAPIPIE